MMDGDALRRCVQLFYISNRLSMRCEYPRRHSHIVIDVTTNCDANYDPNADSAFDKAPFTWLRTTLRILLTQTLQRFVMPSEQTRTSNLRNVLEPYSNET